MQTTRYSSFAAFAQVFPSIVRKAIEEQRPYRERFFFRKGHTDQTFGYLPQNLKDELQKQWVKSPEFQEMVSTFSVK